MDCGQVDDSMEKAKLALRSAIDVEILLILDGVWDGYVLSGFDMPQVL